MNLIKQLMPNQLVQNGNFADTSVWLASSCTLSVSNNVGTITATSTMATLVQSSVKQAGHKYLYKIDARAGSSLSRMIVAVANKASTINITNSWQTFSGIVDAEIVSQYSNIYLRFSGSEGDSVQVRNFIGIDLTELYGAGNEPSTVQAFKNDFPLDYYPYRATSGNELLTTNLGGALTCDLSQMLPSGVGCVDWQNVAIQYNSSKQVFEVRTTDRLDNSTDLVSNLYVNSANALAEMPDMTMRGNAGAPYIYIKNASYTDVQSFKQAMQGVPLLYKKA